LLAKGAEGNSADNKGEAPWYVAVKNGHEEAVLLLLDNGADINAKDYNGWTPLKATIDAAAGAYMYGGPYQDFDDVAALLRQHGGHE